MNEFITDWFIPMDMGDEPINEDTSDFDNYNFDFFMS